jgi:hypothetical protein
MVLKAFRVLVRNTVAPVQPEVVLVLDVPYQPLEAELIRRGPLHGGDAAHEGGDLAPLDHLAEQLLLILQRGVRGLKRAV